MRSVVRAGRMHRTARTRPRRSSSGVWRAPRRRRGRRGGGRRGLGRQPQPPSRRARVLSASMVAAMPSVGSGGSRASASDAGSAAKADGSVDACAASSSRRRAPRRARRRCEVASRRAPGARAGRPKCTRGRSRRSATWRARQTTTTRRRRGGVDDQPSDDDDDVGKSAARPETLGVRAPRFESGRSVERWST